MAFNNKFASAVEQAAEHDDYNEAVSGGEFKPLEEGPCILTLVGYIELGIHDKKYNGAVTGKVERAAFIFEVNGPKIAPREDGQPHLITETMNKTMTERSTFFKLFRKLNQGGTAKVPGQLLGKSYRSRIRHYEYEQDGKTKTNHTIKDIDKSYVIQPTWFDDEVTGERREVKVPEIKSEARLFLWNYPDMEQWKSIFIDGEYEAKEGKPAVSKNRWQNLIKSAHNWDGSPMQELLVGELDVGEVEQIERSEEAKSASQEAKDKARGERERAEADVDPLADDDIPF